jgi:hypothetical protein
MTDIIGTDGKEIKSESKMKKDKVLKVLEETLLVAKESKEVEQVFVLVKIKGVYVRHSTQIDDVPSELGRIDMLKNDILTRANSRAQSE